MSNTGVMDGEVHRIEGVDNEYNNLVMIPIPINRLEIITFTSQSDIKGDHLKPHKIGIRRGVKYAEEVTQNMDVYKTNSMDQLFRMLGSGRVDAVVASHISGLQHISSLKIEGIKTSSQPWLTKSLYHYLHKKHEHLIPLITQSLKELEAEGFIQKTYDEAIKAFDTDSLLLVTSTQ